MTLERVKSGQYILKGIVTFDNAASVEQHGRKLLEECLGQGITRVEVNLSELIQGDSSTLSVCLSWLRLASKQNASFCLSHIPGELLALAKVCGIDAILKESSCPAPSEGPCSASAEGSSTEG